MSLKNRMKKLERERGGVEPDVTIFNTVYEDKEGNADQEKGLTYAIVEWGPRRCAMVGRTESESIANFEKRLDRISRLSWEEAKSQNLVQKWGS